MSPLRALTLVGFAISVGGALLRGPASLCHARSSILTGSFLGMYCNNLNTAVYGYNWTWYDGPHVLRRCGTDLNTYLLPGLTSTGVLATTMASSEARKSTFDKLHVDRRQIADSRCWPQWPLLRHMHQVHRDPNGKRAECHDRALLCLLGYAGRSACLVGQSLLVAVFGIFLGARNGSNGNCGRRFHFRRRWEHGLFRTPGKQDAGWPHTQSGFWLCLKTTFCRGSLQVPAVCY